ncbi:MAG: hypothetical protein JWM20_256 [Patescibacteria group bacterium]|nr:hypothetical protein [Patescibacteria group bacterium]
MGLSLNFTNGNQDKETERLGIFGLLVLAAGFLAAGIFTELFPRDTSRIGLYCVIIMLTAGCVSMLFSGRLMKSTGIYPEDSIRFKYAARNIDSVRTITWICFLTIIICFLIAYVAKMTGLA